MPILFCTVLIDLIGFGIVIPILPFFAPEYGGTKLDIALIIVVYAVCSALCSPLWGRLSDRIGRKPVLLVCLAGAALSYFWLSQAQSLWEIYAGRIFAGVMAGNFGVASAMVADISKPQDRAKYMGMVGAAFGLGLVLGPALGGVLAGGNNNFPLAFTSAGVMSLLAMAAGWVFLPESHTASQRATQKQARLATSGQSLLSMLRSTGNTLLVLQYLLHSVAITTVSYLFPLWVGDLLQWGAREVGIAFAAQGLLMAGLQGGAIGRLVARFGEWRLLIIGAASMIVGSIIAMLAAEQLTMLVAFFITVTGGTLCGPVLNAITSKRSPPHLRGRMMGTTGSMSSWGRVVGPLVSGALLGLGGYALAWSTSVVAAAAVLVWALKQRGHTAAVEY